MTDYETDANNFFHGKIVVDLNKGEIFRLETLKEQAGGFNLSLTGRKGKWRVGPCDIFINNIPTSCVEFNMSDEFVTIWPYDPTARGWKFFIEKPIAELTQLRIENARLLNKLGALASESKFLSLDELRNLPKDMKEISSALSSKTDVTGELAALRAGPMVRPMLNLGGDNR